MDGANPLPARYNEQVASRAAFQRCRISAAGFRDELPPVLRGSGGRWGGEGPPTNSRSSFRASPKLRLPGPLGSPISSWMKSMMVPCLAGGQAARAQFAPVHSQVEVQPAVRSLNGEELRPIRRAAENPVGRVAAGR